LALGLELDEVGEDAAERAISLEEARVLSEQARRLWTADYAVYADGADEEEGEDPYASPSGGTGRRGRGKPVWFEEYLKLVELGWSWRVAVYIAWAASPKVDRWPRTMQELATKVLGLRSPRAIYTWRKRHGGTMDQVIAMMQAKPLFDHLNDVIRALTSMAMKEDYKSHADRKLFLEMVGMYTPHSQVDVGVAAENELEGLSEEELLRMRGEAVNGFGERIERIERIGDRGFEERTGASAGSAGGEGNSPSPRPSPWKGEWEVEDDE